MNEPRLDSETSWYSFGTPGPRMNELAVDNARITFRNDGPRMNELAEREECCSLIER